MDWTSIVLYGTKSKLGKYGYSRDHRPNKLQITVGISELADPMQSFRFLKENSRSMLIMRRSVNTKFFQVTVELPGKRNISRVF